MPGWTVSTTRQSVSTDPPAIAGCRPEILPRSRPKLTAHQRQAALARPRAFDAAHEIADDLDLIGIGRDLDVGELILDQDQQFQAVEPVGPEIVTQVRLVGDAADLDVQMFGDQRANVADLRAGPAR